MDSAINHRGTRFFSVAYFAFLACTFVCVGDTIALYVFGSLYPGYNHDIQPMSALGASKSPIAHMVSAWWVFIGVLLILFGLGYKKVYKNDEKSFSVIAWLIMLYGAGDCIGSGLFPGNHVHGHLTSIGIVHNIVGGIGVISLLVVPFIMLRTVDRHRNPWMYYFSIISGIAGLISFLFFTLTKILHSSIPILYYRGLWQRIFMFIYYVFLMVIAYRMWRYSRRKRQVFVETNH